MNNTIFQLAKNLFYGNQVKQVGVSPRAEYYEVISEESTNSVKIENTPEGTLVSCSCQFASLPRTENLNRGRQPLCKHILASLYTKNRNTSLPK